MWRARARVNTCCRRSHERGSDRLPQRCSLLIPLGRIIGLYEIAARGIGAVLVIAFGLLLAGCNNQYEAPPNGTPATWGQQHYLDVQAQRQMQQQRRHVH
jgi:hypothetical protein